MYKALTMDLEKAADSANVDSDESEVPSDIRSEDGLQLSHLFFWFVFVCTVILQLIAFVLPFAIGLEKCEGSPNNMMGGRDKYVVDNLAATAVLVFYSWFLWHERASGSFLSWRAKVAMFFGWSRLVLLSAQTSTGWCLGSFSYGRTLSSIGLITWCLSSTLYTFFAQGLIQLRLETICKAAGMPYPTINISVVRWCVLTIGIANGIVTTLCLVTAFPKAWATTGAAAGVIGDFGDMIYEATRVLSYTVIGTIVSKTICCVLAPISTAKRRGGYLQAEAKWVGDVLRRQLWSMTLPCVLGALVYSGHFIFFARCQPMLRMISYEPDGNYDCDDITIILTIFLGEMTFPFLEAACLVLLVGAFTRERPNITLNLAHPSMTLLSTRHDGDVWEQTLDDLAHRSVDVMSLLAFYDSLGPSGSTMPSYTPLKSSTNDVVRQAIIPLSRTGSGGVAYANILSNGARTLPDVMVTHAWSGLFLHLVSAVVADALGHDDYEEIAEQLAQEGSISLRRALSERGTLHVRYWICAFCVNQHASICSGFGRPPPRNSASYGKWYANCHDSVTGEPYPCCTCNEPKFFNESPDKCELNKFDSMMDFFRQEIPHFRQAIAVDREFAVFTRAWCVAEIVRGHLSDTTQKVYLHSNRDVDIESDDLSTYTTLVNLSVANCEASRPEDCKEILARIPDIAEFDMQLQFLVFRERGLLNKMLAGFDKVEAAAVAARRVAMAVKR